MPMTGASRFGNPHGARNATVVCVALLLAALTPSNASAQLNENCVVSILNRTAQVRADGTWRVDNVPAGFGPVRARATCVQNGATLSGQSQLFIINPNQVTGFNAEIVLGPVTPIPTEVTVTAPTTQLTSPNQNVQLTVTASYANAASQNITLGTTGTTYLSSNPAIASITANGLVTARSSGTALIQAQNEGTTGLLSIAVVLSRDSDGDGIADDVELANGLNPANPADGVEDIDHDGLNNRDELARGTMIRDADTDNDGLNDGPEVNTHRTNPLLADTDADGVPDGIEITTQSDPLNPASRNLAAALNRITITPSTFVININSIEGVGFQQLAVTGEFKAGGTIDLTNPSRGTNYSTSNLQVCNFGAEAGRIFGGSDGSCTITATNSGFTATAAGTVRGFTPSAISQIAIPGYANNVDAVGAFAYVAAGASGLQVVSVSNPAAMQIVGSADTPGNANDVRVILPLAFIADGTGGLRIFDVTTPATPVLRGTVPTNGEAMDVMVFGSRAYIGNGDAGLAIVNVANPAAPTLLKQVDTPGITRGVDVFSSNGNTYAVIVDDTPSPALRVIDVTVPANATIVGTIALAGNPKDVRMSGPFALVAAYTGGLQVIDLTNPALPVPRGSLPSQFVPRDVEVSGNFALFAEQLFPNAVPVVDITNPAAPVFRTTINFSGLGDYAGTGIALSGAFLYMTGESFIVGPENGTTGNTRLFVGQYLPNEDRAGVPPVVSLTSPQPGSSAVRGSSITLRANATDDVAVAAVVFSVNGIDVSTDTSAPYEALYTLPQNATNLTILARAVDLGNNVATSAPISITGIADPLTTVTGRILRSQGLTPIVGATVTCLTTVVQSVANGAFTVPNLPTIAGDISCSATFVDAGRTIRGRSANFAPVMGGTTNVGDIALRGGGTVGYFDLTLGQGSPNQVSSINVATATAVNITNLTTFDLSTIDVLYAQNPDNGGYSQLFRNNLAKVHQFVSNGGVLILHDRAVSTAASVLPGSPGNIVRDFTDSANVQILDNTTLITNGPGGEVTNTTLDGGNSSTHGWILASSLPAGSKAILSTGDATHVVTYSYPHGSGHVIYSTIPLDHYLQGSGGAGINAGMRIYAANVIAYANDLP